LHASFETPSGPVGPGLVSHKRWSFIEVSCHNHITMESAQLEPILRIAAALALAERLAKLAGVQTPSVIRSRMNQVLSQALGHSGADE